MKRIKDQQEFYPLADWPTSHECGHFGLVFLREWNKLRAKPTGEFRCPKAGEWFLSGSIVEAYRTKNDLNTEYFIAKLVKVRTETVTIIEQED